MIWVKFQNEKCFQNDNGFDYSVDQTQIFEEYVFWAEKSIQVGSIVG